jgi:hypothetical protein
MRKAIFISLCDALKAIDGGKAIKHIDLWNRQVEFLQQETAFGMPAVFIEFVPIDREYRNDGVYKSTPTIKLHVVSKWEGSAALGSKYQGKSLEVFDLLDKICVALTDLAGDGFHKMVLYNSATNHNHEDIIENIESYRCITLNDVVKKSKISQP